MGKSILIFATNPQDLCFRAEIELTLKEWDELLEKAPTSSPWVRLKQEYESVRVKVTDLVKEIG